MSHGVLFSVQLCTTYATNFIIKTQVEALYTHMRNEYIQQPLELVRVMQNCLVREAELVERQEQLSAPSPLNRPPSNSVQIQQYLQNIINKTEAMEQMFRPLSAKLENFILQYTESYQIEAALRAGNRIPPDQVGKFKERKQILDQIVAKDAEQMKRTCIVCSYLSMISASLHLHSGGLVTSSYIHLHVPVSTIP